MLSFIFRKLQNSGRWIFMVTAGSGQSSYTDVLCMMLVAAVAVTVPTLVRGNMAIYHRHIEVYTCFHLFGHAFGFVSCSGMHSLRESSLKQITSTEDQDPGN